MILVATIALALQTPTLTGGEVFSKMLAKYHAATSLKGTIAFNQMAGSVKVQIFTSVQHQKPNLFFIEQTRLPKSPDVDANQFMAVSDGKRFGYTVPKNFLPMTDPTSGKHQRLFEAAPGTVDEGLNIFCTFLLDRSLPVAIALYNPYEIQRVTTRFNNLKVVSETEEYEGKPVYRISANYTLVYAKPKQGQRAIEVPALFLIDKEFHLRYVSWQEVIGVEPGKPSGVTVTNEWVVNLQVDPSSLDKSLFAVR